MRHQWRGHRKISHCAAKFEACQGNRIVYKSFYCITTPVIKGGQLETDKRTNREPCLISALQMKITIFCGNFNIFYVFPPKKEKIYQ